MADVYLAEQQSLKRQVAFKVLKKKFANDQKYIRRFHQEAQSAAALVHPNIIQIFEVGEENGTHFIAQEYVRGQNLKQFLQRQNGVDPLLAINMMRQVASALHKAGQEGIVHRDIKPENIMVSSTGEIKVADFGLARLIEDPNSTQLTQVGMAMGTPLYMSPEQIEGRPVDQRSDIYSFGVTCYQMLTGETPFVGETAISVAVQHINTPPVSLALCRPDLPAELCDLIHKMMEKSPSDRFHTAGELLQSLHQIDIGSNEADWSASFDKISLHEAQAIYTQKRLETSQNRTQQMNTKGLVGQVELWKAGAIYAASIAGLFLIGFLIPILAKPSDASRTVGHSPRETTVEAQYQNAVWEDSERGWKSVAKYFPIKSVSKPDERRYVLWSKLRLAGHYLANNELPAAEKTYLDLIGDCTDQDNQCLDSAKAGLLIIKHLGGDVDYVRAELPRVLKTLESLDQQLLDGLEVIVSSRAEKS